MTRLRTGRTLFAATLAAAAGLTAGCEGFINSVQSDFVAMAAIVKTPDVVVPAPTQEAPLATRTEPGKVVFTLFFGEVDKDKIVANEAQDGAFTPVAGAVVKLQYTDAGGAAKDLGATDSGEGKYLLESGASGLTYESEKDYTAVITHAGKTYRMKVKAPAAIEIHEFKNKSPPKSVFAHTPGSAFTLTRDDVQLPAKLPVAFAALQAADGSGANLGFDGDFGWTNVPTDALPVLKFLLNDSDWRKPTFTVPGDKFAADSDYIVLMAAIDRGGDAAAASDASLFTASSFLAGTADGGLVSTKPAPQLPQP